MRWTGGHWVCRWRPRWPQACGKTAAPGWRLPSVSTVDTLLLGAAVDALHLLVWGKTKDGQKGRSRPELVVNRLLGVPGQRQATGFSCAAEYEAARARILGAG